MILLKEINKNHDFTSVKIIDSIVDLNDIAKLTTYPIVNATSQLPTAISAVTPFSIYPRVFT